MLRRPPINRRYDRVRDAALASRNGGTDLRAALASETLPAVIVGRILLVDDHDVVACRDRHVARRKRDAVAHGGHESHAGAGCTDQRCEQRAHVAGVLEPVGAANLPRRCHPVDGYMTGLVHGAQARPEARGVQVDDALVEHEKTAGRVSALHHASLLLQE